MQRSHRKRQQGEDDQRYDDPRPVSAREFLVCWTADRELPGRQSTGGPDILAAEFSASRLSSGFDSRLGHHLPATNDEFPASRVIPASGAGPENVVQLLGDASPPLLVTADEFGRKQGVVNGHERVPVVLWFERDRHHAVLIRRRPGGAFPGEG